MFFLQYVASEFDFGCFLGTALRLKILLAIQMEQEAVRDTVRELADSAIEQFNGFVIALAGDIDAIFRSFQLILQIEEILVGFQVGIALHHDHQARLCGGESSLGI